MSDVPRPDTKKSITKRYYLENIYTLLEGFTQEELLHFCYDMKVFRPVYHQLSKPDGKAEIINKLIEYAHQKLQLEPLLSRTKKYHPTRYKKYQPYYGIRILFVDDNEDWRKQLGGLLQDHGYEVVTVTSKEEAIQRITDDEQYTLAIIDMRLDEEDEENREGVELGFWLRNNGYSFPIIIMSAYNIETEIIRDMTLRPFQFVAVEKGKIGSGDLADLLRQIELATPS